MTAAIIIGAMLLGLITGSIARHKGDSFATYWLFGALLFIFALPYVVFVLKDKRRRCPHCVEVVNPAARVCPHCQRSLLPEEAGAPLSA